VFAGYKGEGGVGVVRSLYGVSMWYMRLRGETVYPWVYHAWCLHQDYLLEELDAAYP
jgi:hypothetical protein